MKEDINCCQKRYQKVSELPYGRDVVQMLIEKELLKGNEKGDLDLTMDMVRILIILYRAKVFEKIK